MPAQDPRPTLTKNETDQQFTLRRLGRMQSTWPTRIRTDARDFHSSGTQPLEMADQISIAWGDRRGARPFGSAFTNPGRRLSRIQLFRKLPASCRARCPQAAKPEEPAHGLELVPCPRTFAAADLCGAIGRSLALNDRCGTIVIPVAACVPARSDDPCPNTPKVSGTRRRRAPCVFRLDDRPQVSVDIR